jgi:hypothetical protein
MRRVIATLGPEQSGKFFNHTGRETWTSTSPPAVGWRRLWFHRLTTQWSTANTALRVVCLDTRIGTLGLRGRLTGCSLCNRRHPHMQAKNIRQTDTANAAAKRYLARGWSVLPLRKCDKRPLISWEHLQIERPTEHDVADWFRRWRDANVGIVTGEISNLIVLDIDPKHGGDATLERLERRFRPLSATVEAVTGGGGRHLYFAHPGGLTRNRAGLAQGIDLRGDGGYVVAPPSIHPSGQPPRRSPGICCGTASTPMWRSSCCWPGTACAVGPRLMTPRLLKSWQASPECTKPKSQSATSKRTRHRMQASRQLLVSDCHDAGNVANLLHRSGDSALSPNCEAASHTTRILDGYACRRPRQRAKTVASAKHTLDCFKSDATAGANDEKFRHGAPTL